MIDAKNIVPQRNSVIVKITKLQETFDELVTPDVSDEQNIAVRFGEVISTGPDATSLEQCPGLKKGDIAIFTEFAGYFIATGDNNLYKVLHGSDIIGKYMSEKDIEKRESAIPTGNRVLVSVEDLTKGDDGLIMDAKDPRLADLIYGKVIKVNDLINNLKLKKGQTVAFAPYAGTSLRNYESEEKKELRIVVEEDILFTV